VSTTAVPREDLAGAVRRSFALGRPVDVVATLAPLWRRPHDHTMLITRGPNRVVWRATRTPEGPAVQALRNTPDGVESRSWGAGAAWLAERAPVLVGALDDLDGFAPDHPLVSDLLRRHATVRIPCTQAVFEAALPAVLEQKVTGVEARRSLGRLQRALGEPAPVPVGGPPLLLPPHPEVVAGCPSHVFHAAGVERKRSDTIRRLAARADRLEEAAVLPLDEGRRRLAAFPGIGPWTMAEIAIVALGDADAVSVGDYHLKNWVAWNLGGRPRGTDDEMLELLEPFRPHRGRVLRLLQLGGSAPPRYGPRLAIQDRW
jgi:3-methyladenine DNA glycosylase/8-oxoguanine DNA glycosylase